MMLLANWSKSCPCRSELNEYIAEFEAKNKHFAAEIDSIFVAKKQQDEATTQVERQIAELHQQAQRKINELEPQKLHRYNALLSESQDLMQRQDGLVQSADALMNEVHALEGASGARQSHADEYGALAKRRARLHKEARQLEDELAIWELPDVREAQQRLKERVEAQSKELKQCDSVAKDLKEQIRAAQQQLSELGDELAERKGESGGDKDKYEKLRQRDDEMTAFSRAFDDQRDATGADQRATADTVVALLEHISQGLEQQHSMPSQQRLREMRDEATFKQRQLESSQQTMSRLLQERKQREAELEKIANLDEKVELEVASLMQNMAAMRRDMAEFDDVDGLRQRAQKTTQHLQGLLKDYRGRRESVRAQVAQLTTKYEGLKGQIQASDVAKTLSTLEAKLRTYAQNVFHLQEFVETKGRETDYKALKENCTNLQDKLNAHAKAQTMP
jgi:intraflagellar transport protein 74